MCYYQRQPKGFTFPFWLNVYYFGYSFSHPEVLFILLLCLISSTCACVNVHPLLWPGRAGALSSVNQLGRATLPFLACSVFWYHVLWLLSCNKLKRHKLTCEHCMGAWYVRTRDSDPLAVSFSCWIITKILNSFVVYSPGSNGSTLFMIPQLCIVFIQCIMTTEDDWNEATQLLESNCSP